MYYHYYFIEEVEDISAFKNMDNIVLKRRIIFLINQLMHIKCSLHCPLSQNDSIMK